MTNDPAITPHIGGFFNLRAGLQCFIHYSVDHYGHTMWGGDLLPPSSGRILWYTNGQYSPARGVQHELDIVAETLC